MAVTKEIQFPVSVRWRGGRLARADGRDKESLELAVARAVPRAEAARR